MNRNHIRNSFVGAGASALLLAASMTPATAAAPMPDKPDHEAEQEAAAETCGGMTGTEAVETWGEKLDDFTPEGTTDPISPSLSMADTANYEPCDGLSAIVVPYAEDPGAAGGDSFSTVMLFDDGEFIGTDTATPRQRSPEIERVNQDTLQLTYGYGDRSDAVGPEGYVVSTFTWDEATQSLDHSGELPPAV